MNTKLQYLLIGGITIFSFAMLTPSADVAAADKPIILKAGGVSPPTADVSIAAERFAQLVAEKTHNKVKIMFYPSGQLGNMATQLENVTSGLQDMFLTTISIASRQVKDFTIMQMPYAFRSNEHLIKFMESPVGQELREELLDKWNTRIISYNWWRMPRVIFAKKPIFKVEDMRGMKFRIPALPMWAKYVPVWGASPTRVAWGEYYLALRQGLVDMGESCAENIFSMKFYEAAPYITMIDFNYDFSTVSMNNKRFQSLPKEAKEVIISAANEAGEFFTEKVRVRFEQDKKKMMKQGAAFIQVDTTSFQKGMPELAEQLEEEKFWRTGLFRRIQQL